MAWISSLIPRLGLSTSASKTTPLLLALLAMPLASAAVNVRLSPSNVTIAANGTQTFTAKAVGTNNSGIYWSVNGDPVGNSLLGTLSPSGNTVVYTAPA